MSPDAIVVQTISSRTNRQPQTEVSNGRVVEFSLSDAGLHEFPVELFALDGLRVLQLPDNAIEDLPKDIGRLTLLRKLDLRNNQLQSIPHEIGGARVLQELDLRGNKITAIPESIGGMRLLTNVDLRDNRIRDLPPSLSKITAPVVLSLDGNPLADPFPELLQHGTESLLTFLGSLAEGVPQYEAKLLLVGEGNVGKSSTVAALRGDNFLTNRLTTHGIELGRLILPHPTQDTKVVLHTWDFGGQPVYRITHQFFYSRRALYLVIWRPREGTEDNFVEFWLDRIRLRLPEADARILVIATHADERLVDIDEARITSRFPKSVQGFLAVDNKSNRGVDDLRLRIALEAMKLPQMGRPINPRWSAVRDELLNVTDRFFIRAHDFDELCRKHQVDEYEGKTLLNLLHDLGRLIHFSDDSGLRDLIVLNPEWLTKAIGFVIEDETVMQNAGVLEHSRLRTIWLDHGREGEPRYEAELHPYFLRLMEKFDISYRLRDTDESLIGQMVPYRRPALPPFAEPRRLSLLYEMEDEPPGLMPWLIVRNHRFSVGQHWRRGVYLRHRGHTAQIELDTDGRRLTLTVGGESPDYFFHILIDGVEHLIEQRWAGLRYTRSVPCTTVHPNGTKCIGRFRLETLVRARERGILSRSCDECLEDVSVTLLLTGFAAQDQSLATQLEALHGKLDIIEKKIEPVTEVLQLQRTVLKAIASENRECPRLFSLWPVDPPKGWHHAIDLKALFNTKFELWLWCDHPECPHPVAQYTIGVNRKWFTTVAPYALLIAKTLKVGIPVFGNAMAVFVEEPLMKVLDRRIKLMEKLCEVVSETEKGVYDNKELETGLNFAEGAGLRELYALLLTQDPSRRWGGLDRKLNSATGDWQWICPRHYREYDPGLPQLPGVRSGG